MARTSSAVSAASHLRKTISLHPLWFLAALITLIKIVELWIDHQPIFFVDSGAYLLNAVGYHFDWQSHRPASDYFFPSRSFIYGWIIHWVAMPWQSFLPVLVLQSVLGGLSAWLTGLLALRYFRVRAAIALSAGIIFAVDPVQVVHEHLILPETMALAVTALFLAFALEFLRTNASLWLIPQALLGVWLVSLRIVYLPLVVVMAVLVPVGGFFAAQNRSPKFKHNLFRLAGALAISLVCTAAMQSRFRHLTGQVAHREPAYSYDSGAFLLANVSSLVTPADATDPVVAQAIAAQQSSDVPLTYENRQIQLWRGNGLIERLRQHFGGNTPTLDQVSNAIARRAIRRDPIGFLGIGLRTYSDYWLGLSLLRYRLPFENGRLADRPIDPKTASVIASSFGGFDIRTPDGVLTPARRYHEGLADWSLLLLITWPFLLGLALCMRRTNRFALALMFCWSGMLLAATCLGSIAVYRYLQPFSLPALISCAILLDGVLPTPGKRLPFRSA